VVPYKGTGRTEKGRGISVLYVEWERCIAKSRDATKFYVALRQNERKSGANAFYHLQKQSLAVRNFVSKSLRLGKINIKILWPHPLDKWHPLGELMFERSGNVQGDQSI
jgi:hypothetical protein